jgi:sodium transport system permease protein
MRWSIIRTIWFREMRDQMRDRRTLVVILGLPVFLYPILGYGALQIGHGFVEKPSIIGVVGGSIPDQDFPQRQPPAAVWDFAPPLSYLAATPMPGQDLAQAAGVTILAQTSQHYLQYPLLIEGGHRAPSHSSSKSKPPPPSSGGSPASNVSIVFLEQFPKDWLQERKFDLVLEAPRDFFAQVQEGEKNLHPSVPLVQVHTRPEDERSRLAQRRLMPVLKEWRLNLRKVRLARHGMTEQYLAPFDIRAEEEKDGSVNTQNIIDMVVRIFPFLLVMWSLAGALYPAVDLAAGEKERGTMETLLITPAGREEIVLGKFLTIWVFSSATALLNLLSMGISTLLFADDLPLGSISIASLLWCALLSVPQSAFFSAISLAIGAYARSTKEGQYYLMPLFVLTMPLIFLTLVPGVTLNAFYSLVPVTGVALLMQELMTGPTIPWGYFAPVIGPIGLYSWLALRWAIAQFNREEVLFREAERLDIMLWLKSLFRDKEPLPTAGQAFFCLALLIGLRWVSLGIGDRWPLEMHTAISQLAFVAMPALFMVLLLNTQPKDGLYLRWPSSRATGLAALLAMLLLPAMTGLTQAAAWWFPKLLDGFHPLVEILRAGQEGRELSGAQLVNFFLAFALVPALCEELAFRGFVLRGLHHGFRPRNAVLLSSFFFALFHMNVFLFMPTFVLGVILGLLTIRSRSILPAMAFHLLHNTLLIALIPLGQYSDEFLPGLVLDIWPWLIVVCLVAAASLVWWLYRKPYVDLAMREAEESRQLARSAEQPTE